MVLTYNIKQHEKILQQYDTDKVMVMVLLYNVQHGNRKH